MKNRKYNFLFLFLFSSSFLFALRNPFLPIIKRKISQVAQGIEYLEEKEDQIVLKAIVKSDGKNGAILAKGFDSQLVFVNDKVWDYKVAQIDASEVSLQGESGTCLRLG